MKLDTSQLRYLTSDDFRVLQAVELGSRNHELVPTQLIHSIGELKAPSGTRRALGDLAKLNLIGRLRNANYDGFRITYTGYDFLALKSMLNRNTLYAVGSSIGVGKEADIYSTSDPEGRQRVLKIHRLGRTSFKSVKKNRDYLKNRLTGSWMYLSRLAAKREHEFMTALYEKGFDVPCPLDYSRHTVLMEWIDGTLMKNVRRHSNYKKLYSDLMRFILNLACIGLIHCDFNEFNIIIRTESKEDEGGFVVIDFPQCISIEHPNAEFYFQRDVDSIRNFFAKKFKYEPKSDSIMLDTEGFGEGYKYSYPEFLRDVKRLDWLDRDLKASGYSNRRNKEETDLENAMLSMRIDQSVEERNPSESGSDEPYNEVESDEDDDESGSSEDDTEQEKAQESEDNEKIVQALTQGKNLKTDKLGNILLD